MKPGRDPLTLAELQRRFSDEEKCLAFLERARWPEGKVCPNCGAVDHASRLTTRPGEFTCLDCMRRFSVTADTPMHKTHLPISTWIIAAYLLTTGSKGISSLKLASLLGLQYRTTWHLTHQIRAMMLEAPDLLRGLVELDEISIGGRRRRSNRSRPPAPIALLERSEPPKPKTKAKTKAKRKRGRGGGKTMTFDCRRARRQGAHGPDRSPSSSSIGLRSQPMTFLDIQELVACKLGHIQVNHSAEARDDQRTGLRAHAKPFANLSEEAC